MASSGRAISAITSGGGRRIAVRSAILVPESKLRVTDPCDSPSVQAIGTSASSQASASRAALAPDAASASHCTSERASWRCASAIQSRVVKSPLSKPSRSAPCSNAFTQPSSLAGSSRLRQSMATSAGAVSASARTIAKGSTCRVTEPAIPESSSVLRCERGSRRTRSPNPSSMRRAMARTPVEPGNAHRKSRSSCSAVASAADFSRRSRSATSNARFSRSASTPYALRTSRRRRSRAEGGRARTMDLKPAASRRRAPCQSSSRMAPMLPRNRQ